jgi:formylglycine-generating enzyme required for sulfatase activity
LPPTATGFSDVTGNVWEWTSDYHTPRGRAVQAPVSPCCKPPTNPHIDTPDFSYDIGQPGAHIPRRVIKGGSHLCSASYCLRYRPAARQPEAIDTSTSHIGFRCVIR